MNQQGAHPGTSSGLSNEDLVRRFYVPFNTGDVGVYDDILSPDWVDDPLGPDQQQGPKGIKAKVTKFRQTIPGYHVAIDELLVAGDRVAVHSTVTMAMRPAAPGSASSAPPFAMRTCDFHHLANGRIVYTWHLEDFYGLYQHLGALPGH
jgi:hypothetical protein